MFLAAIEKDELGSCGSVACQHCGTKFQQSQPKDNFCCSGCEYVYRIICDESLDRFYDLRGSVSRPVGSSVFGNDDFAWLPNLVSTAELSNDRAKLTLGLEGVSCVGCVWLVDRLFQDWKGALSVRVNVQYGTIDIEWRSGDFDVVGFFRQLKKFGYRVCPAQEKVKFESKQVAWRLGLAGAFALNGMLYTLPTYLGMEQEFEFAVHFNWLSSIFATLSMVFGGSYFVVRAVKAAFQGIAHLDMPISIGLVFAYLISWYGMLKGEGNLVYFDFVSTFTFLMLAGKWLQVVAVERNRNRLADVTLKAPEVEISTGGEGRVCVSADEIRTGSKFWLRSGQRVPVKSILRSPRATFGMDWISGESESLMMDEGAVVSSGAELHNKFQVELEAKEDWEVSLLAKLSEVFVNSRERDQVAQKWIFRYLIAAFGLALLGGLAWSSGHSLTMGLMVFISVLVVSCPCALGIAWPFADEIALMKLKQNGVFVTAHSLWNRLTDIRTIVFDKTGTLTRSMPSLENSEILDSLSRESLAALSSLCAESRHPVSCAIRENLMATGRNCPVDGIVSEESVGLGLEIIAFGKRWRLGRSGWSRGQSSVGSETSFVCEDSELCTFQFSDQPLADSKREISALKSLGMGVWILSGDSHEKASRVGRLVGIEPEHVLGGLLPAEKAAWLRANAQGEALMVGDGANDTLAFEVALCCGAPANEQGIIAGRADFHYLGNGIQGIRRLLEMGASRRLGVRSLLVFAVAYNLAAVGLALAGFMSPLLAAILMPVSSIASMAIVWALIGRKRSSRI